MTLNLYQKNTISQILSFIRSANLGKVFSPVINRNYVITCPLKNFIEPEVIDSKFYSSFLCC